MNDIIDIELELDNYRRQLEDLVELNNVLDDLVPRDASFANDLTSQYLERRSLSPGQWKWVTRLLDRVRKAEPVYGDFRPIMVMFQLAGEHLKYPKVRLMTKDDTFVQLNFKPNSKTIDVYRDGWQGHGYRKFTGWIHEDRIVPYRTDRMTDDVKLMLHEFSLDPIATAKAMANKLGACMYCAQRLSTKESKQRGYGPVCASHYGLPWGGHDHD